MSCCLFQTLQGVSGLVKERMEAAARGKAAEARPMLLFPEVSTSSTSCTHTLCHVTAGVAPQSYYVVVDVRDKQTSAP